MNPKYIKNRTQNRDIHQTIIQFLLLFILYSHPPSLFANISKNSSTASIYRYYDHHGIANISTNITANHIQYGYEILNQNMQVIKKYPAFNFKENLLFVNKNSDLVEKTKNDARLIRAYGTSANVLQQKKMTLDVLNKHIIFQQMQLDLLLQERINLIRDEMEYIRTDFKDLNYIKNQINQNTHHTNQLKKNIQNLKITYHKTILEYDQLIHRLQKNE